MSNNYIGSGLESDPVAHLSPAAWQAYNKIITPAREKYYAAIEQEREKYFENVQLEEQEHARRIAPAEEKYAHEIDRQHREFRTVLIPALDMYHTTVTKIDEAYTHEEEARRMALTAARGEYERAIESAWNMLRSGVLFAQHAYDRVVISSQDAFYRATAKSWRDHCSKAWRERQAYEQTQLRIFAVLLNKEKIHE